MFLVFFGKSGLLISPRREWWWSRKSRQKHPLGLFYNYLVRTTKKNMCYEVSKESPCNSALTYIPVIRGLERKFVLFVYMATITIRSQANSVIYVSHATYWYWPCLKLICFRFLPQLKITKNIYTLSDCTRFCPKWSSWTHESFLFYELKMKLMNSWIISFSLVFNFYNEVIFFQLAARYIPITD